MIKVTQLMKGGCAGPKPGPTLAHRIFSCGISERKQALMLLDYFPQRSPGFLGSSKNSESCSSPEETSPCTLPPSGTYPTFMGAHSASGSLLHHASILTFLKKNQTKRTHLIQGIHLKHTDKIRPATKSLPHGVGFPS